MAVSALACAATRLCAQTSDTNAILPYTLDLKPVYQAGANGKHKTYSGRKMVDGLPFNADGEAVLYGKINGGPNGTYPKEMTGIKVGRPFDELHLLHSVQWREYFGCPVASIRLHYADGATHDFVIRYNFQVNDWARLLTEEQEIIADPDTKIIWRGEGIHQGDGRLFKSVLRNPFPNKSVETLDVISTGSRASYVLVAATVAKSDPRREVTAPLPLEPGRNFDGVLKVLVVDDKTGAPMAGADVYPSMAIDGDGLIADPILTGSNGVALVKYPVSRTAYLGVQVGKGDDYANRGGNWQSGDIPAETTFRLGPVPKITGVVHRPDGQPADGVEVRLIAAGYGRSGENPRTDQAGKFELALRSPLFEPNNNSTPCLLVRDPGHNLAVAQDLDEDATTLDLKLAPALTLVGRAECEGKPITNATAQLVFWTGHSGAWLDGLARTNTPGQFEIPALPPGRRYGVIVSAPGYGQKQNHNLEISAEPGRQELDTVELKPANLKLAGQVLDADDQPVADCSVNLNGDGQPSGNTRTDREGRFRFEQVCEGPAQISANNRNSYGNISAEGGDTNVVLRLGQTINNSPGSTPHKLKGTVTDADGKPVSGAQVAVFPNNGTRWIKTATDGAFSLTWSLQPWQMQSGGALLVVRDAVRNLGATEELPEETTNLDVKLKPALTVAGLVREVDGSPLAGAQVGVWLKAGNSYEQLNEQMAAADAGGRYEIKCLPPDAPYTVYATAKNHGRSQQQVQSDSETNLVELSPFVLKPTDRVLAGQVLNENDKPVAGVNVQLSGEDQPEGFMITDSQGRFHFQVCEGQIRLFAYSQNGGGNAQAAVEAGDTNIVLNLSPQPGMIPQTSHHASLKGSPLPDLASVNLASDASPAGRPVLLCLFDASQRPSRHVVRQLEEQAAALRQRGVAVLGVQAAVISDETFNEWKKTGSASFPFGRVTEKSEKSKWASAVPALPWLILADANHRVAAEGFALDELDAQIKNLAK